jgi:hypothetical protein
MLMQSELFEREKRYHSALSIAKTMLKRGIITTDELSSIDTLLREKYGSSLAKLYSVQASTQA